MRFLKSIYKAMPLRMEFFSNRLLRISPRSALNDPYDFYPFSSDLEKRREIILAFGSGERFSEDISPDEHLSGIGVISFTEAIDNILIWAHYANSHKGMIVEFDTGHNFFSSIQRVRYTTQRPDLRRQFPEVMGSELYFKSDQWMYEKEWRIVKSFVQSDCIFNNISKEIEQDYFPSKNLSDPYFAMSTVPPEAVKSVIFGCRVSSSEIKATQSIIHKDGMLRHIKFFRTDLNPDKFELKFNEIH